MNAAVLSLPECPHATAGELAAFNLEHSLDKSWCALKSWPDRPGIAQRVVSEEQQRSQFLGDASTLDRLLQLSCELCETSPMSADKHLVVAQIASMRHHFADAKVHVAKAKALGTPRLVADRLKLALSQALGENIADVLATRQAMAAASESLDDLVPLGALLADLGEFEDANRTYLSAIRLYKDVSPFPLAWACFQLGVLWGETVPTPDRARAAHWYRQAIAYVPAYSHARVHLAEIYLDTDELDAAEALLQPVVLSGDPEVRWRLTQVLAAQEKNNEAERMCEAARLAFEALLAQHELAYADHAAEFFLSSGSNPARACELARVNLANRPTLRAYVLAHTAAEAAGDHRFASELILQAQARWGHTKSFAVSPLVTVDAIASAFDVTGATL